VIEVPAGPNLFDIYDRHFMHYRRYSMRDILRRLRGHGFTIVDRTHLGILPYPAFWAIKKRNRHYLSESPERQRVIVTRNMNLAHGSRLMDFIMRMDAKLGNRMYLPFGIRCAVTCVRTV
jgi:hypothetical protein